MDGHPVHVTLAAFRFIFLSAFDYSGTTVPTERSSLLGDTLRRREMLPVRWQFSCFVDMSSFLALPRRAQLRQLSRDLVSLAPRLRDVNEGVEAPPENETL